MKLFTIQNLFRFIKDGKIEPETSLEEDVTFHDACYVGRHHGEYDAPRDVLQSALSEKATIKEMPRNKQDSFCWCRRW